MSSDQRAFIGLFSAIEARFGVTSLQASFTPALFEFSSLLLLLPLSYIGGRSSQPRILAIGLLGQIPGTLVLLIPHFATVGEPSEMRHLMAHAESYEPGYCTPQCEVKFFLQIFLSDSSYIELFYCDWAELEF